MLFLSACRAAAELCVLPALKKSRTDWLSLAVSLLRISVSFLHCFLESFPSSPAQQKMPVNHLRVKEKEPDSLSSFPLTYTTLCLQPWRMSNSILACRLHPSCLYQWLTFHFATLAKKSRSFDEFCSCTNLADNLHLPLQCCLNISLTLTDVLLVRQKLLCRKIYSCS